MTRFGVYTDVSAASADLETRLTALSNRIPTTGVFNVKDAAYGAVGNGVADDTAAIQAAATALEAAGGGVLYFPAGIYKVTSTITLFTSSQSHNIAGRVMIRGEGGYGTIIRTTVAPVFRVGNQTNGTDGFDMADLLFQVMGQLYFSAGLVQLRLVRYYHIARVGMWSGSNLATDLYSYSGFLFEFDTSYIGHIDACHVRGRAMYMFEITGATRGTEQQDTFEFSNCTTEGMCMGIVRSPSGSTDIHNLRFTTPKFLMDTSFTEANVSVETTLNGAVSAGASSIVVTSATSLAAGDCIWLDKGTNIELVKIDSSYVSGTTIPLANPMRYAHSSGAYVLKGGFGLSFSPKNYNVDISEMHAEFCAAGVLLDTTRHVKVSNTYASPRDVVRVLGGPVQGLVVDRATVAGNGGVNNVLRVTTAGDNSASVYYLRGPFFNPNTGNPPTTLFQNDSGNLRPNHQTDIIVSGVPTEIKNFPTSANLVYDSTVVNGVTVFSKNLNGNTSGTGDLDYAGGYRQQFDGWYQENVAANQVAVLMSRLATTTDNATKIMPIRAGSITGVSIHSNAAITNGNATVTVYLAGVATALTATLNSGTGSFAAATSAKDAIAFAAGAQIDLRITTDGTFAPTTADIRASVEIEQ